VSSSAHRSDQGQESFGPSGATSLAVRENQWIFDVFIGGQKTDQVELPEDEADAPITALVGEFVIDQLLDFVAVDAQSRLHLARQDSLSCLWSGFAETRRPHDRHKLALHYREGDAV
jgi:hypothetical protein